MDILTPEEAKSLLHLCQTGKLYELEAWIESGRSLTTPPAKTTPLTVAIKTWFHSLVELLLRHETDQEAKNQALAQAVSKQRPDLVELGPSSTEPRSGVYLLGRSW